MSPGAHNDNEEEDGEERRTNHHVKDQFLMVVMLLSLDTNDAGQRTHNILALYFYDTD